MASKQEVLEPIRPGEILHEEFLRPMGISISRVGREIVVPPGRISPIANGKRGITAETAMRLGRGLGVSPQTWMARQADCDLRVTRRAHGATLEK